jgi:WD40-like Beta Propeller Repeat
VRRTVRDRERVRRSRILRWTLLGLLAQLLIGVAPAAAEFPGPSGRIFFTTPTRFDFPPACGAASVSANGTGYECVDPFGFDPSVSPNHRLITEERPGVPVQVYSVNLAGRGARRLTSTSGPDNLAPTFSPDSRRILYFQNGGNADGVYVMNADGSGQRRLTADAGFGPVFSPNGAQIAYFGTGITIAGADGGGSHAILANTRTFIPPSAIVTQTNSEPNWSPDGRQIIFTRQTATIAPGSHSIQVDVYVMNADGTGVRQLTSTPGVNEEEPSWSPDGLRIAYFKMPERNPDGLGEIWVMNADGGGARRVALGWHPHWSSVQGGPGRPRLVLGFRKINRHSSCLGKFDGFVASVKTRASALTLFDFTLFIDGRKVDQVSDATSLGGGVDLLRRGTHRLKFVMTDPAVHDTVTRSATFRVC